VLFTTPSVNVRDKAPHPKKTAGKMIHIIVAIQVKLLIILTLQN
jgi:hypothetical protein